MLEEKEEHNEGIEEKEETIQEDGKLKRHLHFWDGVGILISIIIG